MKTVDIPQRRHRTMTVGKYKACMGSDWQDVWEINLMPEHEMNGLHDWHFTSARRKLLLFCEGGGDTHSLNICQVLWQYSFLQYAYIVLDFSIIHRLLWQFAETSHRETQNFFFFCSEGVLTLGLPCYTLLLTEALRPKSIGWAWGWLIKSGFCSFHGICLALPYSNILNPLLFFFYKIYKKAEFIFENQ